MEEVGEIAKTLGLPAAAVLLLTVWFKVVASLDDTAPFATRDALSKFLTRIDKRPWPILVSDSLRVVFDAIFGSRVFTRTFMFRSFLASTVSVTAMVVLWRMLRPHEFRAYFEGSWAASSVALLMMIVLFSFVPDLISMIETRWVVGRLHRSVRGRHIAGLASWMIVDFALTTMIAVAAFLVWWYLFLGRGNAGALETFTANVLALSAVDPAEPTASGRYSYGIVFYATYCTSVWAWLYALAIPASAIPSVVAFFKLLIDVKRKPFRYVAAMSSVVFALFGLLLVPLGS